MMALVRLFFPSTKPLLKRVGRKSKNARISRRQLRKADKALRSSAGPWLLTRVIQASKPLAAVEASAVSYQERRSSLSCQALPISGNRRAKFALLTLGPAGDHRLHRFAHMLDDMKVIGHDASPRQAQLDGSPEGLAHIHAHRFHPIAVGEALEQTHDIVLLPPSTHLEHLAGVEVAQDRVVALSLAPGKLINP